MGPLLSSRHTATGCPWNRVRRVWTQALIPSGLCSRLRNSRCSVPETWRQTSCFASAQSRPIKAANALDACGFMGDLPACGTVVPRDMPACVLRRHYPYNTGFSAFLGMIKLQYLHKYLIFLKLLASY